jgi:hypothetical protein
MHPQEMNNDGVFGGSGMSAVNNVDLYASLSRATVVISRMNVIVSVAHLYYSLFRPHYRNLYSVTPSRPKTMSPR